LYLNDKDCSVSLDTAFVFSRAASAAWERYIFRKQPTKLRRVAEFSSPGVTATKAES
jgi:ribosome maturation factor RimP